MILSVFQDEFEVSTVEELRQQLRKRSEGIFSSFWLSHENGSSMALMLREEKAYIHYFPEPGHPGFQPEQRKIGGEGFVEFLADNRERTEIPSALVMPAEDALAVFEEYFASGAMPVSLVWNEL